MCLACYAGLRRLVIDGQCTEAFSIGGKSLVAGCGFATTFLKVYAIKIFDMMWRWYPEIQLHVFVDDVDMNNTARTEQSSSHEVVRATTRLLTEFQRVLGLRPGISKCVLMGSTATIRTQLMEAMKALPPEQRIPVKPWGKKLGVQFPVQTRRLAAVMKQRRDRAATRARRFSRLSTVIPRRPRNQLYNSAAKPVATYGGSFWGLPDTAVQSFRGQASIVNGGVNRFRSTRVLCLLEPEGFVDPAFDCHALPIMAWARTIWLRRFTEAELSVVLAAAKERLSEAACPWRSVNGPGQAFLLTCLRIGWVPLTAALISIHDGRTMDLRRVPPAIVAKEFREAVQRWTWRCMAAEMGRP